MTTNNNQIHSFLEQAIRDLRAENSTQHRLILGEIQRIDCQVSSLKEWKAKTAGIAAAVSALISAAAWVLR